MIAVVKIQGVNIVTQSSSHLGLNIRIAAVNNDGTATRVLKEVEEYRKQYCDAETECVYWIMGHSRGAAIANILGAKLIDNGNTVFAYTFATPNTTTVNEETARSYTGIFNLINSDDLVPYLPTVSCVLLESMCSY